MNSAKQRLSESPGIERLALDSGTESLGFSSEEIAIAMDANHPLLPNTAVGEASSADPLSAVPLNEHW
jgi:hypothetical protein